MASRLRGRGGGGGGGGGLASVSLLFMLKGDRVFRWLGALVGVLTLVQVALGISMIEFGWPLPVADAHNGAAALLLGSVVALVWSAWTGRRAA